MILEPILTDEIIVRIFEHLCICEIRKRLGLFSQHQEGSQDGYVMCLSDLFGSVDDATLERAFNEGKTYLHVIDTIMGLIIDEVDELKAACKDENGLNIKDAKRIIDIARLACQQHSQTHAESMVEAIKLL